MASFISLPLPGNLPQATPASGPLETETATTTRTSEVALPTDSTPALDDGWTTGGNIQFHTPGSNSPSSNNSSGGNNTDPLTASPVYLFIFAIALGILVILSLTIVIRSFILRRRLMALHGPNWRGQPGTSLLEILGFSGGRVYANPEAPGGTSAGRRRRRNYGPKPVMVEVCVGDIKADGGWSDLQPYSTSLRHPESMNASVKASTASLLSLRAKEFQPVPPPNTGTQPPSNVRPARVPLAPAPAPSRSPFPSLRRLPFRAASLSSNPTVTPTPRTAAAEENEKATQPATVQHSRSSSTASSVDDLKLLARGRTVQPLPGLDADICLLVCMPNPNAPSYRFAGRYRPPHHRDEIPGSTHVVGGGLEIGCAPGVQLWGPAAPAVPPTETRTKQEYDQQRRN